MTTQPRAQYWSDRIDTALSSRKEGMIQLAMAECVDWICNNTGTVYYYAFKDNSTLIVEDDGRQITTDWR